MQFKKLTLDEQIDTTKGILDQAHYDLKRAKAPKNQKQHKRQVEFWTSISESLNKLKMIEDSQAKNIKETKLIEQCRNYS